jgi:hypothetical protein
MSAKPGRNDPCHCGSGKKYKRCHLPIEERERGSSRASAPGESVAPPSGPGADENPREFAEWGEPREPLGLFTKVVKMASRSGLLKRDPELRRLYKENEGLLTYAAQMEEVRASSARLEKHRADFDRLCLDQAAYATRAAALFAEAAFIPFRFTPADLRRAFAEVDVPVIGDTSNKAGKLARKALLFLAT